MCGAFKLCARRCPQVETLPEILLDELAARAIAQERGAPVVGFAGVLIRASWQGLLSAESVRDALVMCQRQGTHYSDRFITEVYRRLKEGAT